MPSWYQDVLRMSGACDKAAITTDTSTEESSGILASQLMQRIRFIMRKECTKKFASKQRFDARQYIGGAALTSKQLALR